MNRLAIFILILSFASVLCAQVLDKQKLLDAQTFWDNRDWDWYAANIPFLDTPDADINTTYYYRWELVTKHIVYGSPESGYNYTEFIDRPFWSGRFGSISCPAGHQIDEVRWLKDQHYAQDYARYWFRTEGAQPRRYSCWIGDSIWWASQVQGEPAFARDLLPDLVKNYQGWEKEKWNAEQKMFWQNGHDDGMEYSITSRQTKDIVRGAPGYRPALNAYLYGDALAIAKTAALAGNDALAKEYTAKAADLKQQVQKRLWDPHREFFFHMFMRDEEDKDGNKVAALSLTHQSGKFVGSPRGREQIGFIPWQFNLPDAGYEAAWKFLMDKECFFAEFGPTVTERNDPMFLVTNSCCWWSGQSWPYATTQTLVAMANLLNNYKQNHVTKDDYVKLLKVYTKTHRKDGKPYIAEGANPDTGSWDGYDSYNHSEHYFHSGYTNLIITGLCGLRPREDDVLEVHPLVPDSWDFFCLDDVAYKGRKVTILWDKTGQRYGRGAGLHVIADGKELASLNQLGKITVPLPERLVPFGIPATKRPLNYAVNNGGPRFPRAIASHTSEHSDLNKLIDGQYWYMIAPPNRWSSEGSTAATDWAGVEFGIKRSIHSVKLYFLDDGKTVTPPAKVSLEYWDGKTWAVIPDVEAKLDKPTGRRANIYRFLNQVDTEKVRAVFTHAENGRTGLSEFEAWGFGDLPVPPAPDPGPSLATNKTGQGFPKASASYTCSVDNAAEAIDGKVQFAAEPRNRWTAYESKNKSDWLEIDFGKEVTAGRVELYIYDDRGGVRPPESYTVEYWDGQAWKPCAEQQKTPAKPAGGRMNTVEFTPVKAAKIRLVFVHRGNSRAGVTEVDVW